MSVQVYIYVCVCGFKGPDRMQRYLGEMCLAMCNIIALVRVEKNETERLERDRRRASHIIHTLSLSMANYIYIKEQFRRTVMRNFFLSTHRIQLTVNVHVLCYDVSSVLRLLLLC